MTGQAIAGKKISLNARPYGSNLDDSCLAINLEEFRRDGPYRTEYDGHLSGEQVIADIARFHDDRDVLGCTAQYVLQLPHALLPYLSYGNEPNARGRRSSPMSTGIAVHRVLQRFYQERCSNGRSKLCAAERDLAIGRLRDIAREEAAKGTSVAWKSYMDHLIGTDHPGVVSVFVDFELKDKLPALTPKWIELSYGPHALENGDPTSSPDPVLIPIGEDGSKSMKLECRIDRIDSDPQGNFFVIDYKTSAPVRKCLAVHDLQIPLYILAIESAVPGSHGIGGGTFHIGSTSNTRNCPPRKGKRVLGHDEPSW